jgi:hypothetical protein
MSDSSIKLSIEPLSNGNWYKWKVQMKAYMVARELWTVIQDGDAVKVKEVMDNATEQSDPTKRQVAMRDATAMSILLQTVDDSAFNTISGESSACTMWQKLKSRFEDTSAANRRLVYNEWRSLVFTGDGSIRDYIAKFDAVVARYIALGGHLDADSKSLQLLDSIHSDKYDPVLKSPSTMQLKYDELCSQLIMYEDTWVKAASGGTNGSQPVEAALAASQRYNSRNNNNNRWRGSTQQPTYGGQRQYGQGQQQRRALVCYRCDREGHKAVDCPDRVRAHESRENAGGRREFRQGESTRAAYAQSNGGSDRVLVLDAHTEVRGWLLDSGASHHITNDKSLLLNYKSIDRRAITGFSDEFVKYAVGEGDVRLRVMVDGAIETVRVTSVWYVPGAHTKLLSVSALQKKGCKLVFENHKCIITLGGEHLFTAVLEGNLYAVVAADSHPPVALVAQDGVSIGSDVVALWHRRLLFRLYPMNKHLTDCGPVFRLLV